jgi:hypothetical protein
MRSKAWHSRKRVAPTANRKQGAALTSPTRHAMRLCQAFSFTLVSETVATSWMERKLRTKVLLRYHRILGMHHQADTRDFH